MNVHKTNHLFTWNLNKEELIVYHHASNIKDRLMNKKFVLINVINTYMNMIIYKMKCIV